MPFVQVGTYPTRNFALAVTFLVFPSGTDWSFLPASSCRHEARTVSSTRADAGARRSVSEGSSAGAPTSLLIVCTEGLSLPLARRVPPDAQMFQHIARVFVSIAAHAGNECHLRTVCRCYSC